MQQMTPGMGGVDLAAYRGTQGFRVLGEAHHE
jgi:hypothetical protein